MRNQIPTLIWLKEEKVKTHKPLETQKYKANKLNHTFYNASDCKHLTGSAAVHLWRPELNYILKTKQRSAPEARVSNTDHYCSPPKSWSHRTD